MSLFRKKSRAPLVSAFVGGGVLTLGLVAYGVIRWLRALPMTDSEEEVTDFSDPYIPAHPRPGSRKAVHAMV